MTPQPSVHAGKLSPKTAVVQHLPNAAVGIEPTTFGLKAAH